MQWLAGWN